tara:strand:- start:661 stop:1491 length:831 start_codon:yes stop_codon:yes gene_type:complete
MENIIITPYIGLPTRDVVLFLESLRKFYNDKVLFFVKKNDHELKKTLKYYECLYEDVSTHRHDVCIKRYTLLINYLKKNNNLKKIFFCDSRDIYFQSSPFSYSYEGQLNFFSEDTKIGDCPVNSKWMKNTLGLNLFDELKEKFIVCCGTVIGNKDAIINYANEMNLMSKKYPYRWYKKRMKYLLTFRRDKAGRGSDQPYAAYLIHKNCLKNIKIYGNASGPIATVYNLSNLNFNNKNQLINDSGNPYVIVHQYDKKWDEFKNRITLPKKYYDLLNS